MRRIQFFKSNDYACTYNLDKAEQYLLSDNYNIFSINDCMEAYNVCMFLDKDYRYNSWDDSYYEILKKKCSLLKQAYYAFFNNISDDNLKNYLSEIEYYYISDFWNMFEKCKLQNKISENAFVDSYIDKQSMLSEMLCHSIIVNKYNNGIRTIIMSSAYSASILIEKAYMYSEKSIVLPSTLTNDDINIILTDYINKDDSNMNDLDAIEDMHNVDRYIVYDETRLLAKRKYNKKTEEFFSANSGTGISVQLGFHDDNDDSFCEYNNLSVKLDYSSKWIKENLDPPTLLNNFIYVFEFVDRQMRCLHTSKMNSSGVWDRFVTRQSPKCYPTPYGFTISDMISMCQINAYYNILNKYNVRLEEIIKWFFMEYLPQEFTTPQFRVETPSEKRTFLEKCTIIASAFDSVLKEYELYCKHNDIDYELLAMSSKHIIYKDLPSKLPNKYLYGVGKNYETYTFLLFSDQCLLHYVKQVPNRYSTFYDLITNEKIHIDYYVDHHKSNIEILINANLIMIDDKGIVSIKDKIKVSALRDLYFNEVINFYRYPPICHTTLIQMMTEGLIEAESTLLSRPEIAMFNYYLNKAEYINGKDLRNMYAHGIYQVVSDEKEHEYNYLMFLRLFIILIIKINDEFDLIDGLNLN